MSLYADSNYAFNPWMRDILPQMEPDNDGIALLQQEELIMALNAMIPVPPPAGLTPRFGYRDGHSPTLDDVLNVGPTALLMKDTETRQDSGTSGSEGPRLAMGQ